MVNLMRKSEQDVKINKAEIKIKSYLIGLIDDLELNQQELHFALIATLHSIMRYDLKNDDKQGS